MKGLADLGVRAFAGWCATSNNVFDEIEAMEVPVIAAINGVAAGGGLELALSCDFRFATSTAKMGLPENNVGLIPDRAAVLGWSARWPVHRQAHRRDR